jgi:hypothetical protein
MNSPMNHTISQKKLTIADIQALIESEGQITLSKESESAIIKCREYLDSKMADIRRPVYGVTTGFGSLCNITIPAEDLSQLQHNLVMSHACGTGEPVRKEIVKLVNTAPGGRTVVLIDIVPTECFCVVHNGCSRKNALRDEICAVSAYFGKIKKQRIA